MKKNKIEKQKTIIEKLTKLDAIKTNQRNIILTKDLLNKKVQIYNGIRFFDIIVQQNMLGHKLGEFAPTRFKPVITGKKKRK